jgi:hypothetical protein
MQVFKQYLLTNRVTLVADLADFVTEYRQMYKRNVKVYKGIDNTVEFQIKNADQKSVSIDGKTVRFDITDTSNRLLLTKNATILDDGSTKNKKGLMTVKITEGELLDIDDQLAKYSCYIVDTDGQKTLLYADTQFGATGTIEIIDDAFPMPSTTHEVDNFLLDSGYYYSNAVTGEATRKDGLHTMTVYSDSFNGTFTVEVTLNDILNETALWSDYASYTVDFTQRTQPFLVEMNGLFTYIRVKYEEAGGATYNNIGKLDKFLVRN